MLWFVNSTIRNTNIQKKILREGCTKKTRKKCGLLPNSPRTPPPSLAFFQKKNLPPFFLLKIASLMAETNFTLGPTSKTNKFPLLFLVIVGQNSQHKRAKSDTFKVVFKARYIFKQLQTKCKTCFGGPRMILHANWKNTLKLFGYISKTTLNWPFYVGYSGQLWP